MKSIVNRRSTKLIAIILSLLLVFSVSSTAVLASNRIIVYEREPNNEFSTATKIEHDLSRITNLGIIGTINNKYDTDYYKITLSTPATLTFGADWAGDYSNFGWHDDLILQLYDANHKFIGGALNEKKIKYMRTSLPAGTYYIEVFENSNYESLYVNQTYAISLLSESVRVSSISVSKSPNKTNYVKGDSLKVAGGKIRVNNDFDVSMSEATFSGFNSNSKDYGPQTVTVKYGGATTNFTVYLNPFYDVPFAPKTHDFYYTIQNIVSKGIMRGKGDGKYFGTADKLTRAEAAVALVRAAGLEPERGNAFSDVPRNHWANAYINAIAKAGIVKGKGPGRFAPNDNITRAELAVMVSRAFKLKKDSGNVKRFSDVPSSYWANSFIENLTSNGIVGGYPDGRFGPDNPVTRGQFTAFVWKAMNRK